LPNDKDDAGIALSFDDDYFRSWEGAFPLFARYGARVTFFVKGTVTPFCIAAQRAGHEVAYPTLSHRDLRGVGEAEFERETTAEIERFRRAGVRLEALAFPFGFSELWMASRLSPYYAHVRGFGVSLVFYHRWDTNGVVLRSKSIDNIMYRKEARFRGDLTFILRAVKFCGGDTVAFLTTHRIAADADWGISPQRLEWLLKTANGLRLRFWRFSDLSR
jgi:peptidoglycan/xylan/chitin deacetylase (PgdA/CDA1 family)